ncbi:MAG: DUF4468 domain-containing protein [Leptospiraceae bacterium]|nr:DUF4468 domain-containing protein [Leptospiraceae bacterium]
MKFKVSVYFLIFIILNQINCLSMMLPDKPDPNQMQLQKIVTLAGKSKNEIFQKTIEWLTKTFIPNDDVVQLKDNKEGLIIAIGNTNISYVIMGAPVSTKVFFKMKIEIKDGKARVTYDDYYQEAPGKTTGVVKVPLQYKVQMDTLNTRLDEISKNYELYVSGNQQDNW